MWGLRPRPSQHTICWSRSPSLLISSERRFSTSFGRLTQKMLHAENSSLYFFDTSKNDSEPAGRRCHQTIYDNANTTRSNQRRSTMQFMMLMIPAVYQGGKKVDPG